MKNNELIIDKVLKKRLGWFDKLTKNDIIFFRIWFGVIFWYIFYIIYALSKQF